MKMCAPHWDELRRAIDDAGMGHLVNKSGEELFDRSIQPELEGEPAKFDPLFSAAMAIYSNAIQAGGLYLMTAKEDGTEYCPVCEAFAHGQKNWIAQATNACKEHCIEDGLIPGLQ